MFKTDPNTLLSIMRRLVRIRRTTMRSKVWVLVIVGRCVENMKVEFRCVEEKFNDKPGGSNDVGNVTVSGGNVVLPCSAYDEPL